MNYFKTGLLLIVLTLLLVWVGGLIGGPNGAIVAFVIALVMNGVSYWFSDKIVLAMYGAKPLPKEQYPRIYGIVERLSMNAGIPCPRIFTTVNKVPNAFATGRDPKHGVLCLTTGIMELLDEDELRGVIAHELAHIKNHDTLTMTVTAAIAGAVMMIADMARWAAIFGGSSRDDNRNGGNAIALIAVSIIAPIAALLIQLAISRSREYSADSTGAKIAGTPQGLARALEELSKYSAMPGLNASPQTAHMFIVNPLRRDVLTSLFATHPPIQERIKRLRGLK
ncbi:MAG TPA: zinc metalloprotease HtpX [Candidatus Omnitrophota bacterium]|nr:zinc metalloprotease HtpX [Candidatus Omnitrophota bacterium]HPS20518.1 zinc metalloprotease HtpX [Candidatus Omnitrophota bacterium]